MNKFDIVKLISKAPIPASNPAMEIIKLATLIATTCLASKIEDIVKAMADEKSSINVNYKEEN